MGPAIFIPMAIGAVVRTGIGIAKGESFGDIVKGAAISAGIGAVTGGIGSALKAGATDAIAQQAVEQGVGSGVGSGATGAATGTNVFTNVGDSVLESGVTDAATNASKDAVTNVGMNMGDTPSVNPTGEELNTLIENKYDWMDTYQLPKGEWAANYPPNSAVDGNYLGQPPSIQKDQVQAISDTPPLKTGSFERPGPGSLLNPRRTPADISTMSDQYDRYIKALEEQNNLNKTKMYVEGAKAGVDTAQALTARDPKPPFSPMGYPPPVQLTGGNIDLMAQLMALAGGR